MTLSELKKGDILFYGVKGENPEADWFFHHAALVYSVDAESIEVIHVVDTGIRMGPLNTRETSRTFIPYRLTTHSESLWWQKNATNIAKRWTLENRGFTYSTKETPPVDYFSIDGSFSALRAYTSALRSSFYGATAREYADYLHWECQHRIPKAFNQHRHSWTGGTFCSAFIISAFQASLGPHSSAHYMALDARNTGPRALKRYLRENPCWQALGEIQLS